MILSYPWRSLTLSLSLSLSLDKATILIRVKESYLIWLNLVPHIPKHIRFTFGNRIDNKFLDLLDETYQAYFSRQEDRQVKINTCILTLDTLKFMLSIAWEAKFVSHQQYQDLSLKLGEIGKMLAGWQKYSENTFARQTTSSNSSHSRTN